MGSSDPSRHRVGAFSSCHDKLSDLRFLTGAAQYARRSTCKEALAGSGPKKWLNYSRPPALGMPLEDVWVVHLFSGGRAVPTAIRPPTARAIGHPALVLRHTLIFGLSPPTPPEAGAPVRARRASGGTGPRAGARGSDAVANL